MLLSGNQTAHPPFERLVSVCIKEQTQGTSQLWEGAVAVGAPTGADGWSHCLGAEGRLLSRNPWGHWVEQG